MSPKLGSLYRIYLSGDDLPQPCQVEIIRVIQVTVRPHPREQPKEKWCLFVKGLPADTPNGVLFGPRGEKDLVRLFGNVDITNLESKRLVLRAEPITVAGQKRHTIRFDPPNGSRPAASPPPEDDIPF